MKNLMLALSATALLLNVACAKDDGSWTKVYSKEELKQLNDANKLARAQKEIAEINGLEFSKIDGELTSAGVEAVSVTIAKEGEAHVYSLRLKMKDREPLETKGAVAVISDSDEWGSFALKGLGEAETTYFVDAKGERKGTGPADCIWIWPVKNAQFLQQNQVDFVRIFVCR